MNFIVQKEDADVVDAVPTRTGIKKNLDDVSSIIDENDDYQERLSYHENEDASSTTSDCHAGHRTPTYCEVFCSLFMCRFLFTRYTIFDFGLNIGAIILYIFDFVTDWLNAFNAYWFRIDEKGNDYIIYFWWTVGVITVPSLVMQVMSLWWEREDNRLMRKERKKNNLKMQLGCFYYTCLLFFHLFQIAPVYRYMRTIYYGLKSRYRELCGNEKRRQFYDEKYKGELADVNFVRLLESFLESAPQVVLQVYIMIKTFDVLPITVLSVGVSLFGMSVSFVSYQRALRSTLDDKEDLTITASIVLFIYRSFTNLSRVLALALLINTSVIAFLLVFFGHMALMTGAIIWQGTHFCPTKPREYLYDVIIGFCYNFSYINVHADNNNACRMLGYYSIMFLENCYITIFWYHFRHDGSLMLELTGKDSSAVFDNGHSHVHMSDRDALYLLIAVVFSFVLGMLFLCLYYLFFHPQAPVKLCQSASTTSDEIGLKSVPPSRPRIQRLATIDNSFLEPVNRTYSNTFPRTAIRRLYMPSTKSPTVSSV